MNVLSTLCSVDRTKCALIRGGVISVWTLPVLPAITEEEVQGKKKHFKMNNLFIYSSVCCTKNINKSTLADLFSNLHMFNQTVTSCVLELQWFIRTHLQNIIIIVTVWVRGRRM